MTANLSALVLFCFWLFGFFFFWRIRYPGVALNAASLGPTVSIIIPARNEAGNIGILIRSLRTQNPAPYEIIVVDDHSSDGTAAAARQEGCAVIQSKPLPEGWNGKPWACIQGAEHSSGDILLFLDADTCMEPGGLHRIVDSYERKKGLLSIQPYHRMQKAYERLAAFFNIITMAGMNAFTLLGDRVKPLGAFGPCLACSRQDYFAAGGHRHENVRMAVLESVALGKAFLASHLSVHCYGGKGSISFRMYPDGFSSLVEGFSKGFATGAGTVSPGSLLLTVCWISGGFAVTRHLVQAGFMLDGAAIFSFSALYVFYVLQIHWMLSRIGNFGIATALFFVIPLIFFFVVFLLSLIRIFILKRVSWKGRIVPTSKEKSL